MGNIEFKENGLPIITYPKTMDERLKIRCEEIIVTLWEIKEIKNAKLIMQRVEQHDDKTKDDDKLLEAYMNLEFENMNNVESVCSIIQEKMICKNTKFQKGLIPTLASSENGVQFLFKLFSE